jgi:uncharacterized protein YbcI
MPMDTLKTTTARQIADAASKFQQRQTGHAPQSVTVVLGEDTLVITLHGALSPAEKVLAQSAAGAAQVQEFHRQLFASSSEAFRREIKRIAGVEVVEAAAEVEPATGAVVHAFTNGTMVQVFLFAKHPPRDGSPAPIDGKGIMHLHRDPDPAAGGA